MFYVANVVASGTVANREVHFALTRDDFSGVFPLHGQNRLRIIGIVPSEVRSVAPITYDHIAPQVARTVDLNVETVNWFSTYTIELPARSAAAAYSCSATPPTSTVRPAARV